MIALRVVPHRFWRLAFWLISTLSDAVCVDELDWLNPAACEGEAHSISGCSAILFAGVYHDHWLINLQGQLQFSSASGHGNFASDVIAMVGMLSAAFLVGIQLTDFGGRRHAAV